MPPAHPSSALALNTPRLALSTTARCRAQPGALGPAARAPWQIPCSAMLRRWGRSGLLPSAPSRLAAPPLVPTTGTKNRTSPQAACISFASRAMQSSAAPFSQPLPLYFMPPRTTKSPAFLEEAGPVSSQRAGTCSERELSSDLPISRQLLTGGSPKRAVRQVAIEKEVGMVEQVVELKPQL